MNRRITVASILVISVIAIISSAAGYVHAQSVSINTTFGTNGVVALTNSDSMTKVNNMLYNTDGSIIATGAKEISNWSFHMAVWKVTPQGTLDTSFGTNGVYTFSEYEQDCSYPSSEGFSVRKIETGYEIVGTYQCDFGVKVSMFRLTNNGTLDTSFNGTGRSFILGQFILSKVYFDTSLNRYIGIGSNNYGFYQDGNVAAVAITTDGVLDTSFGSGNGYVIVDTDEKLFPYSIIKIGSNYYIGGKHEYYSSWYHSDAVIWSITESGSTNTTFNGTGKKTIISDGTTDIGVKTQLAVSSDNKILVYANSSYSQIVKKFNTDSTIDTGFGTNGTIDMSDITHAEFRAVSPYSIQQIDDELVLVGQRYYNIVLFQYNLTTHSFKLHDEIAENQYPGSMWTPGAMSLAVGDNIFVAATQGFNGNYIGTIMKLTKKYSVTRYSSNIDLFSNTSELSIPQLSGTYTANLSINGFLISNLDYTLHQDLDWSGLTADINTETAKAVISDASTLPGVTTYSLFVPYKTAHNAVYVCPHAHSLADISLTCPNGYALKNLTPVTKNNMQETTLYEPFSEETLPTSVSGATFETGGDLPWITSTIYSNSTSRSASSGPIGDSQQSWLQLNVTVDSDSTLTFYWRVESEWESDYFYYCVDHPECTYDSDTDSFNNVTKFISGGKYWDLQTITLTPGSHTIRWVYLKDGGYGEGADAGFVDDIRIYKTDTTTRQYWKIDNATGIGAMGYTDIPVTPTPKSAVHGASTSQEPSITPTAEITVTPTPTVTATVTPLATTPFEVLVTDQNGAILPQTTVVIDNITFTTDQKGIILYQGTLRNNTVIKITQNGKEFKGEVKGGKIMLVTENNIQSQSPNYSLWIVLIGVIIVISTLIWIKLKKSL